MLYIASPWLHYFIAGSLYLLFTFTYFIQSFTTLHSGNYQFILCICKFASVFFFFFLSFFCFLDSTYKQNHIVLSSSDLFNLTENTLGPSKLLQLARFHSFFFLTLSSISLYLYIYIKTMKYCVYIYIYIKHIYI